MSVFVPSTGDFTIGGQFMAFDSGQLVAGPSGDHHSLLTSQDVDVGAMPAMSADIFSKAIAMPVLQPCGAGISGAEISSAFCIEYQDWGCAGADINEGFGAATQIAKKTGWCVPQ